jgi:hypothetical protein
MSGTVKLVSIWEDFLTAPFIPQAPEAMTYGEYLEWRLQFLPPELQHIPCQATFEVTGEN